MTRLPRFLLLSLLLFSAWPAEARPPRVRVVVGPPPPRPVVIRFGPWHADWRPAPRPGWVWVVGQYAANGVWVPGHWEPATPRPGYAWVPGHWVGEAWVEGYWREASRPGAVWVDGYYNPHGTWVPGYWQPVGPRGAPPPYGAPPAPPVSGSPRAAPPPAEVVPEPVEPVAPAAPITAPPASGDIHHDYE